MLITAFKDFYSKNNEYKLIIAGKISYRTAKHPPVLIRNVKWMNVVGGMTGPVDERARTDGKRRGDNDRGRDVKRLRVE